MEKRKCENCKWGNCLFFKPIDFNCGKFSMKPREVYYEGLDCDKFEPKLKENA